MLVPNVGRLVERGHGVMDYFLTQFLTLHGCFKSYLVRFGKAECKECSYCSARDEPRHAATDGGREAVVVWNGRDERYPGGGREDAGVRGELGRDTVFH